MSRCPKPLATLTAGFRSSYCCLRSLIFPKTAIISGFSTYAKERTFILALLFILPAKPSSIHTYTLHGYVFGCSKSTATTGHQTFFLGISLNRDCSYKPKGQIPSVPEQDRKTHSWFTSVFSQTHLYYSPKLFPLSLSSCISPPIQPICHLLTIAATEYLAREGHFAAQPPASVPAEPLPPLAPSAEKPVSGDLKLLIFRPGLTNCQD